MAGGAQANPSQLRERLAAVLEPRSSVTLGKSLNLTIISSSVNEGNASLVGVSSEILVLMHIRPLPTAASTGPDRPCSSARSSEAAALDRGHRAVQA